MPENLGPKKQVTKMLVKSTEPAKPNNKLVFYCTDHDDDDAVGKESESR